MFSLTVRDRFMVAHSLTGEIFGPAQRLHGATYVVEVTLVADALDPNGLVADIGAVGRELRSVLDALDHRNLDEENAFAGVNTTTEVLARSVTERLAGRVRAGALGTDRTHLQEIEVVLRESDVAWAGFRTSLRDEP